MQLKHVPGVKRKDCWQIPFSQLTILPNFNVRTVENYGDIPLLATQIMANGIAPFEIMRKGNLNIVKDGHRRAMALEYAAKQGLCNLEEVMIECYLEAKGTSEEQRIIDMLMHAENEPITALDEAKAYARLIRSGKTPNEIAKMIGKKTPYVSDRLTLCEAPNTVKKALQERKISTTAALAIAKEAPEKQKKIINQLPEGKKTRVSDIQKITRGKSHHISGTYVNDLYETVEANISLQVDDTGRQILECIKAGIHLCKDKEANLQATIDDLRKMF